MQRWFRLKKKKKKLNINPTPRNLNKTPPYWLQFFFFVWKTRLWISNPLYVSFVSFSLKASVERNRNCVCCRFGFFFLLLPVSTASVPFGANDRHVVASVQVGQISLAQTVEYIRTRDGPRLFSCSANPCGDRVHVCQKRNALRHGFLFINATEPWGLKKENQ